MSPVALEPEQAGLPEYPSLGTVQIHHPAVDLPYLKLPCYPVSSTDDSSAGFHLGTLLDSCRILTNSDEGFIARQRDGSEAVDVNDLDLVLPPGDYYFHLDPPGPANHYPICLDFNTYVPRKIPERWWTSRSSQARHIEKGKEGDGLVEGKEGWSAVSSYVEIRDQRCLVSGLRWALEGIRLIPYEEDEWFERNEFYHQAADSIQSIDSPRNVVTMMNCFNGPGLDLALFSFVPIANAYAMYMLRPSPDLARLHHRRTVNLPDRVRTPYLFTRLAWNIIKIARIITEHIREEF
ncbi:hypothetical protein V5O48_010180 [Marasmius crinis-equi]|uniref:HNH nuclease domain-containing protein n=1 Tax=Marasmius crinis-equi TaxID=585013 RepID=A0ABR3F9M1_9AGAR